MCGGLLISFAINNTSEEKTIIPNIVGEDLLKTEFDGAVVQFDLTFIYTMWGYTGDCVDNANGYKKERDGRIWRACSPLISVEHEFCDRLNGHFLECYKSEGSRCSVRWFADDASFGSNEVTWITLKLLEQG